MTTRTALAVFVLAAGLAALAPPTSAQNSRWLDAKTLANWNKPNGAIPKGPAATSMEDIRDCEKRGAEDKAKPQSTAETKQVAARGWHGATVEKRAGDTVFVFARNGVDGMCRPMRYQIFVFVNGKFAGTLAPRPMDSRTDGSGYLEKEGAEAFTATFARYRSNDPLCCPSRTSTVTYAIRSAKGAGPLVVPQKAVTKATQQ